MSQQTLPLASPAAEAIALQATDDKLNPAAAVDEVMRRWHDDTHDGAYPLCQQQPCRAIARVLRAWD